MTAVAPPRDARVPTLSAWWVLIAGVIGFVASLTLTVEKIDLLLNPSYVPSCNINPIVSCGSVMTTTTSERPGTAAGRISATFQVTPGL